MCIDEDKKRLCANLRCAVYCAFLKSQHAHWTMTISFKEDLEEQPSRSRSCGVLAVLAFQTQFRSQDSVPHECKFTSSNPDTATPAVGCSHDQHNSSSFINERNQLHVVEPAQTG
ncbi:hypothetical protein PMIN03_002370 [Paraphaeosphaeria minitans]